MDLKRFLLTLTSGWRVLLACVLVTTALAAAASVVQPRTYEAAAQAVLTQRTTGDAADGSFAADAVSNYARIATTPFVLDRVREQLGLDLSRRELLQRVDATAVAETAVIEITATAETAAGAAALANAVDEQLATAVEQITPAGDEGAVITLTQLQRAIAPSDPVSPDGPLYAVIGLVIGLVLGLAAVVLRELLVVRLRTPGEAEEAVDAAIIGVIPDRGSGDRGALAVTRGARRPRAEAYRALRTNVLRVLADVNGRTLVVAGIAGAPSQDVALNLAVATADTGRSVLLVDADLRGGSLGQLFAVDDGPGLSEVLTERAELPQAVLPVQDGRMDLLPTGALPDDPSELLQSEHMAALMEAVGERYDLVVVSAHALPDATDAAVVAGLAAGTLLVLPLGVARRTAAVEAGSAIERAGARLLGLVTAPARRPAGRGPRAFVGTRATVLRAALGR